MQTLPSGGLKKKKIWLSECELDKVNQREAQFSSAPSVYLLTSNE